jgi:hypothetical protein
MSQSVDDVLKSMPIKSDDVVYRLVQLHPKAVTVAASIIAEIRDPFCALIVDADEITLIMPDNLIDEFNNRLRDHTVTELAYRLITLDVVLSPDFVGFMARISGALADAGISLLPVAAFSRDHIFVTESQFEQAVSVLEQMTHE